MKKFLIAIFFSASSLFAQVEVSGGVMSSTYLSNFYILFSDYKSDIEGKSRVDVFLHVPYASIQFIKKENEFFGKYNVLLSFYDEDKDNILFEKMWSESVSTNNFQHTYSKQNYNISYRDFNLAPQKYTVVCMVEDQNSKNDITYEKVIDVRKFEEPVEISDIVIIKEKIVKNGEEHIVPCVSNILNTDYDDLGMFYEIYMDKPREVFIDYKVEDVNREKSYEQSEIVNLEDGTNFLSHTMNNINLPLGQYVLKIFVKDKEGEELSSHGLKFRSALAGFPISIIDINDAIEQLEYIASVSEIDTLEDAETVEEKMELFRDFWKKKDPSPSTEENAIMIEYYRRIDYSNKHFKGYKGRGWKTDMGMVYIMLGPPDQVYREPVAMDSRPYEYWEYYNIQRTFLFVDQTGFGDFRLVNRDYGDWYRYRP